jgi:transcriptional regulator with XRE-family HTH domain
VSTPFAALITERRRARRLSAADVAYRLGLVPADYRLYESGLRLPNPRMVRRIAPVLGVSVSDLLKLRQEVVSARF